MANVKSVAVKSVKFEDMSLEELFGAAGEIGAKYQSQDEVDEFEAKLQAIRDEARDFGLLD